MMNSDMEDPSASKRGRILPLAAPATQRRSAARLRFGFGWALTEPDAPGVHAEEFFRARLEAERGQELLQSVTGRRLARPRHELARFLEAARRGQAIHSDSK